MSKLTKCKSCGKEIAKNARSCPHCGAPNNNIGCCGIAAIVAATIFVFALIGSTLETDEPKKVSVSAPAAATVETTEALPFTVGDKVELKDVAVTLVNVTENNGGNYMTPSEGKVFIVCEFEIENNSSKDIAVSSIMSFEAYVDDYSTSMNLSAMLSTDKTQLDGTVASGKKMNGIIGYEADKNWSEIEIRFTPDFWAGKDIIFTYSK